ncbi:MAG: sulfotransferase family protein [Chthoniobacterales bacterium]
MPPKIIESAEMPKAGGVCILGMHRSGTSVLTRILNLLGMSLGPENKLAGGCAKDGQPKGYWENVEIIALNNAILERYGGNWFQPPIFPPRWETSATLNDLKERGRSLLKDTFRNDPLWGWKDPRTCLTLPFWQLIAPQMRYVMCFRNPVAVAQSLARRDDFSIEKSSDLWLTYERSALKYTRRSPRLMVFYEDLMDDWSRELPRLATFLGNPSAAQRNDVREAVEAFVEQSLRHHRISLSQMWTNSKVPLRVKALFLKQRLLRIGADRR